MTIKTWQSTTASNEIHDYEGIQVWEIIFWSSDSPNDSWVYQNHPKSIPKMWIPGPKYLEIESLCLGRVSETCVLEKLSISVTHSDLQPTHFISCEGSRFALWEAG